MDGAVAVFDGVAGVEPQSETVWRQANKYGVPRMCFLNKMDRTGANFYRCVDMIEKLLEATPLILQIPIGIESNFVGVIDLVSETAVIWENEELGARYKVYPLAQAPAHLVTPDLLAKAKQYRAKLIETVVDQEETALMNYLEGIDIDTETLKRCIRKGTLSLSFTPVLTGTAFKNKGVQTLLDAVVDYLPSPLDRPPIQGIAASTNTIEKGAPPSSASSESSAANIIERRSDDDEPFAALAFKLMNDPFVGTLTFIRIYSGVLKSGSSVTNTVKHKNERVGRMLQMHANERHEVKEARAGDIIALVGMKDTTTGDTLCDANDEKNAVILEKMDFPEPVIKIAVEPKTKSDQEKMGLALNRLAKEDPSFRFARDEATGQTTIEVKHYCIQTSNLFCEQNRK